MIDVVIDPIALRGDRWFLGKIYYYEKPGYYFGVPLSNAIGWAVVGFVSLWIYQKIENRFLRNDKPKKSTIAYHSLMGVGLYFGVLFFMLSICLWIDENCTLDRQCIHLFASIRVVDIEIQGHPRSRDRRGLEKALRRFFHYVE